MKENVPAYIVQALLGPNMGTEKALKDVEIWVSTPIRDVYCTHRAVDFETYISMSETDLYRDAVAERNRRVAVIQKVSSLLVLTERVRHIFAGGVCMPNDADMINSWLEDV